MVLANMISPDYPMPSQYSMDPASMIGGLIGIILLIIGTWKVFEKAGEPGWKSLIPVYSTYILWKIADLKFIKFVLITILLLILNFGCTIGAIAMNNTALSMIGMLITFCTFIYVLVMYCKLCDNLSKNFGHGFGYALGLFFLNTIFMLILGFNSDTYKGKN